MELSILTTINTDENGTTTFQIKLPREQPKIEINQMAIYLAGAIMTCIKSSDDQPKLMKEVIDFLNDEFVDIDSFANAKAF